tara:strand:+ start:171 stop:296 length:126 start_codon:yes stop_codon:yes gene_type:complete
MRILNEVNNHAIVPDLLGPVMAIFGFEEMIKDILKGLIILK